MLRNQGQKSGVGEGKTAPHALRASEVDEAVSEDFAPAALSLRKSIGEFLDAQLLERKRIGFDREMSVPEEQAVVTSQRLVKELQEFELFIEHQLITLEDDPFLAEVIPHIHQEIGGVMQIVREAWNGKEFGDDVIEPLAFELLDFRAVLTSVALESDARELAARMESALQVDQMGGESNARVLTLTDDSLMGVEILRQEALRENTLPEIQQTVSGVVNSLIEFLTEVRQQEPVTLGFSLTASERTTPLTSDAIIEALDEGAKKIEALFWELHEGTSMEVNYRSYLHGLGHNMTKLRVIFLREHADGMIDSGSHSLVRSQCEATLRSITKGMKQLTDVANTPLYEMVEGEAPLLEAI